MEFYESDDLYKEKDSNLNLNDFVINGDVRLWGKFVRNTIGSSLSKGELKKINWCTGIIDLYSDVYKEINEVDLRKATTFNDKSFNFDDFVKNDLEKIYVPSVLSDRVILPDEIVQKNSFIYVCILSDNKTVVSGTKKFIEELNIFNQSIKYFKIIFDKKTTKENELHNIICKHAGLALEETVFLPKVIMHTGNESIDAYASIFSHRFKSTSEYANDKVKELFRRKWNLIISPDDTFLVMLNYNTNEGRKPYPGKVVSKMTVSEALIKNHQTKYDGQGWPVTYKKGCPDILLSDDFKAIKTAWYELGSRFDPWREDANVTHSFEGLYTGKKVRKYDENNFLNITPQSFRDAIWELDLSVVYKKFLDSFWSENDSRYAALAKASFILTAYYQEREGSLSELGRKLALRSVGLSDNTEWSDITIYDIESELNVDVNIDNGFIKIHEYTSTDILYVHDKTNNKTLLYIPENSSPIHEFDSPGKMKVWLSDQLNHEVKRALIASHFKLADLPNGIAKAGLIEALIGISMWPNFRKTPGLYDGKAFSGYWDPDVYITMESASNLFGTMAKKQKERTYSDLPMTITSDSDVTKQNIIDVVTLVGKGSFFLLPFAVIAPEVALGLDILFLLTGTVEAGVGIDDLREGKQTGKSRLFFGILNAAPFIIQAGTYFNALGKELKAGLMVKNADESSHLTNFEEISIQGDSQKYFVPTYSNKSGVHQLYIMESGKLRTTSLSVYKSNNGWIKLGLRGGGERSSSIKYSRDIRNDRKPLERRIKETYAP